MRARSLAVLAVVVVASVARVCLAQCVDADGDSFFAAEGCGSEVDCDDALPQVYPGAVELCDALDNDCDTLVDEGSGEDADTDGVDDLCDNCPQANASQSDGDRDGEGDVCDLDDGVPYLGFDASGVLQWQAEAGVEVWNVHRGDIHAMKEDCAYVQAVGSSPLVAHWSFLTEPELVDTEPLAPDSAVFYLVAPVVDWVEGSLGYDSDGRERLRDGGCRRIIVSDVTNSGVLLPDGPDNSYSYLHRIAHGRRRLVSVVVTGTEQPEDFAGTCAPTSVTVDGEPMIPAVRDSATDVSDFTTRQGIYYRAIADTLPEGEYSVELVFSVECDSVRSQALTLIGVHPPTPVVTTASTTQEFSEFTDVLTIAEGSPSEGDLAVDAYGYPGNSDVAPIVPGQLSQAEYHSGGTSQVSSILETGSSTTVMAWFVEGGESWSRAVHQIVVYRHEP